MARLCQNRLDIVATQGEYLVPRADTPIFEKAYDEEFAAALARKLKALTIGQIVRRVMYRQAADEWPIGRTPPEVKEHRRAELRALEELEGVTSDGASDSDRDDHATADGSASSEKAQAAPGRAFQPQPQEARWLPTPPLSAHSPIPTLYGRKRRRVSIGDDEERPRKTDVTSTIRVDFPEEDMPNGSQGKGWKRRRADDTYDEGEGDRKRPNKARKTATAAPSCRRRQMHQLTRSGAS